MMNPRHILRFTDGAVASASTYKSDTEAARAARRIAKRKGRAVEVWWSNDACIPKLLVETIPAPAVEG